MRHRLTLIASTALLVAAAHGDPTWPSEIDELEEIMFHMMDFKTRNFADTILPCTNEASGPGRQNAAEWLRLGFHDSKRLFKVHFYLSSLPREFKTEKWCRIEPPL